jgi:ribosome production factor 1
MSEARPNVTSFIGNKIKRQEVWKKTKAEKKAVKRKRKEEYEKADKAAQAAGMPAAPKRVARTLDNTREAEQTTVGDDDAEVAADEADDEFAPYYAGLANAPKVMITTRPMPSKELFRFIGDLMRMVPNSFYYERKDFSVKQICGFAKNKDFTHLMVLSEKSKVCNGVVVSHLAGDGPTAFFKVSNVQISADIRGHGQTTSHTPEIILNRFTTRLGRRVGRFFGSLFPHDPQFTGRQAVTVHNQRDFLFVRHHRYVFERRTAKAREKASVSEPHRKVGGGDINVRARLQELGPRFTLKMRWMQSGTFDTKMGEYEWLHRRKEQDTSRRKFHL